MSTSSQTQHLTMKEAIVNPDHSVNIRDRPIPTPGKDEVLIRVKAFGTNPKDWKFPEWQNKAMNSGDDLAGYVEAVGEGVFQFNKGDRVAGYRFFEKPHGAFAEYAIVSSYAVFRLPETVSFEQAATIPLASMTAIYGLFDLLQFPSPWQQPDTASNDPLIIYGASTAVGAFAIKFASMANIHPIIAVGSATSRFVTDKYLDPSKGDTLIDYTKFDKQEHLADAIKQALTKAGVKGGRPCRAFDGVSEDGSYDKVLAAAIGGAGGAGGEAGQHQQRPAIAVVLPPSDTTINGVDMKLINAMAVHRTGVKGRTIGVIWYATIARALQEGTFTPHPHEIIPNGLHGLSDALKSLKANKVRGKKLVGQI